MDPISLSALTISCILFVAFIVMTFITIFVIIPNNKTILTPPKPEPDPVIQSNILYITSQEDPVSDVLEFNSSGPFLKLNYEKSFIINVSISFSLQLSVDILSNELNRIIPTINEENGPVATFGFFDIILVSSFAGNNILFTLNHQIVCSVKDNIKILTDTVSISSSENIIFDNNGNRNLSFSSRSFSTLDLDLSKNYYFGFRGDSPSLKNWLIFQQLAILNQ